MQTNLTRRVLQIAAMLPLVAFAASALADIFQREYINPADPSQDSSIFFAPGISVALGGTLELTFTDGMNLASQLGRTLDLFDWTGVNPSGAFAISSPYAWDLSNLYTTGEVTLTAVPELASIALAIMLAVFILRSRGRLQKTVVPTSLQHPIPGENS